MSKKYLQTYRGYLVDHHSPALPTISFDQLDIKEYEEFYLEAKINNLMLYCKDHWGYSYYNTQIGYKHPALQVDWIAEQVEVLRKHDIEFNAYYCIEYDNTVTKMHPEWATLDAAGEHLRCAGRNAKWRIPCYMTSYREYVLGQLSEIVSGYHPDSLFLDIFGKSLCYCPTCRDAFKRAYGFDLPENEEEIAKRATLIIQFLDTCAEEFLDDVISVIKKIDPGIALTINFSSHYPKSIRDKLDYHFTEPWAGNWLSAAYARATGIHPQLGPGDVSQAFDYRQETVYIQAASEIAAQGCRVFFYSEPQLPSGRLEHEESRRIGLAFQEVAQFEHLLTDRTHIADICIIQSDKSHAVGSNGKVIPNAISRARTFNRHVESLLGAMKGSEYSKLTWTVLPEQDAIRNGLNIFQVVMLPQVLVLDQELLEVLKSYMKNGGTVIATDETGLFDTSGNRLEDFCFAKDWGVSFVNRRTEYKPNCWGGYADFIGNRAMWGIPDTTVPINEESVIFKSKGEIIAQFIKPAVILGPETWVNWGWPPPGDCTDEILATKTTIGNGSFWYVGFDLFSLLGKNIFWPKAFLSSWLSSVVRKPSIKLETNYPAIVGFTAFSSKNGTIVHLVSHLAEKNDGDAPEIDPGILVIASSIKKITAHMVYPKDQILEIFNRAGGYSAITLPALRLHNIVLIQEIDNDSSN